MTRKKPPRPIRRATPDHKTEVTRQRRADRPYRVEDDDDELVDELEMRRRTSFTQR